MWRYREDVRRLASQLCRHREEAEDVTQSVLLKAAQHLDGFRWEASLRTWLHRVAANECRMLRRCRVPLSLDELLEKAATDGRAPAEPAEPSPGPEKTAEEAETRRLVVPALAGLPDRYRTALLLTDGLEMPAGEGAAAMSGSARCTGLSATPADAGSSPDVGMITQTIPYGVCSTVPGHHRTCIPAEAENLHVQSCHLRSLQKDHLDRLRRPCRPGPGRRPGGETMHLPLTSYRRSTGGAGGQPD